MTDRQVVCRIDEIVVDCLDPALLANFWAAALGYDICEMETDSAAIEPNNSFGPDIYFQKVPEGKVGKNRMHMDLAVEEHLLDAAIERLVELGATRITVGQGPDSTWATMADPEGNEFCVVA